MKKDVYKNRITLNLGKVHTKTSFSTMRNNVLNFGLLTKKKKKKRLVKKEQFRRNNQNCPCLRTQNFINYGRMNPVEITLDSMKFWKIYQNIKDLNIGS